MSRVIVSFLIFFGLSYLAQAVESENFTPQKRKKTYSTDNSPVIAIDEAHYNNHTLDKSYQPFAKILRSDGFTVTKNTHLFSESALKNIDILVIANALNEKNSGEKNGNEWDLPNYSAFTRDEIEHIYHWVKEGGSLLLIADHMPFPKASEELAAIFGFQFNNGYAWGENKGVTTFKRTTGTLNEHPITQGRNSSERIDSVMTFTGQAFLVPKNAESVLIFGENTVSFMPSRSWKKNKRTPEISVEGWSQGATLKFYQGRVAVFGEASMFTAQFSEKSQSLDGLRTKGAEQNEQFLINVMHWLLQDL